MSAGFPNKNYFIIKTSDIDRNFTDYLGQRQEFSLEKRLLFMAGRFILKKCRRFCLKFGVRAYSKSGKNF